MRRVYPKGPTTSAMSTKNWRTSNSPAVFKITDHEKSNLRLTSVHFIFDVYIDHRRSVLRFDSRDVLVLTFI